MVTQQKLIGGLIFTAIFLGCILIAQHSFLPDAAWASTSSRAGDYIVATTAEDAGSDLLWIVNVNVPLISVYESDRNGVITLLASASPARSLSVNPASARR